MKKIIIWGYPLHSHTHSYIHAAFYKAFTHLGYETYWFHDGNYPDDFDWNDCLFWTEGFADKNIPLNKTSVYFVHVAQDPSKYIGNVKKFVDVRYNHLWHKDHVYDYTLDKSKVKKVGPCCYLQEKTDGQTRVVNDYHDYMIEDYDKFYVTWATNYLLNEFDFSDIHYPRDNKIYFCGNISNSGRCENYSVFKPFVEECQRNGIGFVHNDPFANPLDEAEVIERTKRSILGVDLRGPEHLRNGYVPCRTFKSMSWGHLGMTNSPEVFKELDEMCVFNEHPAQLLYDGLSKRVDYKFIEAGMKYVQEYHTYVNRINSILEVV